jgi:hypothetical protein
MEEPKPDFISKSDNSAVLVALQHLATAVQNLERALREKEHDSDATPFHENETTTRHTYSVAGEPADDVDEVDGSASNVSSYFSYEGKFKGNNSSPATSRYSARDGSDLLIAAPTIRATIRSFHQEARELTLRRGSRKHG